MSLLRRIEQASDFKDKVALREWWHGILHDNGRYSCYAIFLTLPSDKETIRYLVDFGNEIDVISGEDCLVIALSKSEYKRSGFYEKIQQPSILEQSSNFLQEMWSAVTKEQVSKGYSVNIAQLFNIEITKLPCLLIFQDIRSSNHAFITLKGMAAEEISEQMRATFSIIHRAVNDKGNIFESLATHYNSEASHKAGKVIFSKASGSTEKTFETAMEAWISGDDFPPLKFAGTSG